VRCPMNILVADLFTKPLQGALFKKLRNIIMGITHSDSLHGETDNEKIALAPVQERVGNSRKQEIF